MPAADDPALNHALPGLFTIILNLPVDLFLPSSKIKIDDQFVVNWIQFGYK